jgi:hypothetical protein
LDEKCQANEIFVLFSKRKCYTVEPLYNTIEGTENFSCYIEVKFEDFCVAGTRNFSRNKEVRVIERRVIERFDCIEKFTLAKFLEQKITLIKLLEFS